MVPSLRAACLAWAGALLCSKTAWAMCPNKCSGHGSCNTSNRCECDEEWGAGDCSERYCPKGIAWSDQATALDTAHAVTECSNRGICDRKLGQCQCHGGFSGIACERTTCPNDDHCSGHGRCLSMREFSNSYRGPAGESYNYKDVWDADSFHTCVCDEGYGGYDCGQRECPQGDDPMTTGQVNEVQQVVVCQASGGFFSLVYEDHVSPGIAFDATESTVEEAIEGIKGVGDVSVTFKDNTKGVCDTTERNVISIEFKQNFGSLRPMWARTEGLDTSGGGIQYPGVVITADGSNVFDSVLTAYPSVKGTKESAVCSNRGLCNTKTGQCECYTYNNDIFAGSDGLGGPGPRGDCGYALTAVSTCPGEVTCSGHGSCDTTTKACTCIEGWTSGDCSQRTCPQGRSWFSYPSANNQAHSTWSECSDGGTCDRLTGKCLCGELFRGAACEEMKCPGPEGYPCNLNGQCETMAGLAFDAKTNGVSTPYVYGGTPNNGFTWDAHRIYGCRCDSGFDGYDCSLHVCPTGDDPMSLGQADEEQTISCTATGGDLRLSFRDGVTASIGFDETAAGVEAALEDLLTIGDVTVTFTAGKTTLCTSDGSNTATVQYHTEHGDLPNIKYTIVTLVDAGAGGGIATVSVAQTVPGTTESETCSHRGLCNVSTGTCECFRGWASGDGMGGFGTRGDCSYRIPGTTYLRGSSKKQPLPKEGGYHSGGPDSQYERNHGVGFPYKVASL
ncbi:unnamed protein product [Chrysoparadoxa australica]